MYNNKLVLLSIGTAGVVICEVISVLCWTEMGCFCAETGRCCVVIVGYLECVWPSMLMSVSGLKGAPL